MFRTAFYLILTFCCCLTGRGDEEYWLFTDHKGKTISARPAAYDAESGKITLKQEIGPQLAVLPARFIERDQRYLEAWIKQLQQAFADPDNYSFSVIKVTRTHPAHTHNFNEVSYQVTIANESGYDFGNVRAECCFFILHEGSMGKKGVMYCETKPVRSGPLRLAGSLEFKTDTIRIHHRPVQYYQNINTTTRNAVTLKEVAGVIIRIYRAGNDGVFLEFSEPTEFLNRHAWNEFPQREHFNKKE